MRNAGISTIPDLTDPSDLVALLNLNFNHANSPKRAPKFKKIYVNKNNQLSYQIKHKIHIINITIMGFELNVIATDIFKYRNRKSRKNANFHAIRKILIRYPVPKIFNILRKNRKFEFFKRLNTKFFIT